MSEVEIKKKRFKALLEGKYVPREITIKEAKKRLRESDPNIDVSFVFEIVRSRNKEKILKNLVFELLTNPDIVVYYMPVIKSVLKIFFR